MTSTFAAAGIPTDIGTPPKSTPPKSTPPKQQRRSPRIESEKKCRSAAKELANAVAERVWGSALAPDGQTYYFHLSTNATAWQLPAGAILQAGAQYVSEQQHRSSPRSSPKPKASPKSRSPKSKGATTSPKSRSPKSKAGVAASPKAEDREMGTPAASGQEEERRETMLLHEPQEEPRPEATPGEVEAVRSELAAVQAQLRRCEEARAESAAAHQVGCPDPCVSRNTPRRVAHTPCPGLACSRRRSAGRRRSWRRRGAYKWRWRGATRRRHGSARARPKRSAEWRRCARAPPRPPPAPASCPRTLPLRRG